MASSGPTGGFKYNPSGMAVKKDLPNFAGFGSSNTRRLATHEPQVSTTSRAGPGSYLERRVNEKEEVTSNVFKTNVARMGPSAPGSTAFVASSAAWTPGPGAYRTPTRPRETPTLKERETAAARVIAATGAESLARRYNPPTIPRRDQSSGYNEKNRCIEPLPRRDPGSFSGVGNDTVGPAAYDIPQTLAETGGATIAFRSTTERRCALFGEEMTTAKGVVPQQKPTVVKKKSPGPGDYDPVSADEVVTKKKATSGKSSFFQSTSPNFFDERKPGRKPPMTPSFPHSAPEKELPETELLGPAEYRPDWPSVLQCFGSTSTRAGWWQRREEMPFTEPTSIETPGPGTYGVPVSSFETKIQKRLTETPIPFASTDVRFCNRQPDDDKITPYLRYDDDDEQPESSPRRRPLTSRRSPGPGSYDVFQYDDKFSKASLKRNPGWGRHGVFGSCAARFQKSLAPPEEAVGPGSYDVDATRRVPKTTRPHYSFRSTTARLGVATLPSNPDVLHVGHTPYDDEVILPTKQPSVGGANFRSTTSRFSANRLLTGDTIDAIPGPGTFFLCSSDLLSRYVQRPPDDPDSPRRRLSTGREVPLGWPLDGDGCRSRGLRHPRILCQKILQRNLYPRQKASLTSFRFSHLFRIRDRLRGGRTGFR